MKVLGIGMERERSRYIMVEPSITFNQLIDEIYESTEIDKNAFDIDIAPIA
ncbi:hypothetical protein PanWU01x14_133480, partial [Parasponia andersonii]